METLFTMRHSVEQYGHNSVLNMKEDNTVSREKYKNTKIFNNLSECPIQSTYSAREKYHDGLT